MSNKMNVHIGPWTLQPNEVLLLFWILTVEESEHGRLAWNGKLVSRVKKYIRILNTKYNHFEHDDDYRHLLQDVTSSWDEWYTAIIECGPYFHLQPFVTTVYGVQLYTARGIRQYAEFLKRMTVPGFKSTIPDFVERIKQDTRPSQALLSLFKRYAPRIPRIPIDWRKTNFGPGAFAEKQDTQFRKQRNVAKLCKINVASNADARSNFSQVYAVPKSWKADRIIAAEPLTAQLQQGAVADALRKAIEMVTPIRFASQEANRVRCKRTYDTIDCTAASDTVRCFHVETFLPKWSDVLLGTRTHFVKMPCKGDFPEAGKIYDLREGTGMFATMGSRTTFPVETAVFYCTVYAGLKLCGASDEILSDIRVYGDDVIVPHGWGDVAIWSLECMGFIPNHDKSFYRDEDLFRETCGVETFDDVDITPIRVPRDTRVNWWCAMDVIQLVDFANKLFDRQLYDTNEFIVKLINLWPESFKYSPKVKKYLRFIAYDEMREEPLTIRTYAGEYWCYTRGKLVPNLKRISYGWKCSNPIREIDLIEWYKLYCMTKAESLPLAGLEPLAEVCLRVYDDRSYCEPVTIDKYLSFLKVFDKIQSTEMCWTIRRDRTAFCWQWGNASQEACSPASRYGRELSTLLGLIDPIW